MKIAILLGCLSLINSGCRRDLPDVDDQYIYLIHNQRTTLPLVIWKHQPHVECTINGNKAVMLIDTGSTGISLFRDRIERFGVKVVGMTTEEVSTAGGPLRFEKGDEFTLTFTETLSARVKYPSIVPNPSPYADGLIGAGFLGDLHSIIDFSSKTITLGGVDGTQSHSLKATDETTSPREDALISEICGELPQGWTCTIEQANARKGHPHGLEEPLFRADFKNPHQVFESPFPRGRKKLNPIIQLYFYDIASKAHVMEVIEKESMHSWDIPIYFGETEKYIVVTSPSYVNYGVFSEDAKKTIRPIWESLRKRIDNKENRTVEELAEPGK